MRRLLGHRPQRIEPLLTRHQVQSQPIFQVEDAVSDVVGSFHQIGQRMTHIRQALGRTTQKPHFLGHGGKQRGQPKGDASNNRVLLEQLAGITSEADRVARFVCALVAVRSADDPQPLVAMGRWSGVILPAPRGEAGFGYYSLIYVAELQRSVAELSPSEKNGRSHRGIASREMLRQMREVWGLG